MLAVLITPPGRGALAVIHVCGEGAAALVKRIFPKKLELRPRAGRLVVDGETVDEVMVRSAPGFTGEETVEISSHGGTAVVNRIFAALAGLGARRASTDELLERGVEAGHLDRIRAEAWRRLPDALTELAARVLQDQAEGALSRAVAAMAGPEDAARLLRTAPLGNALASPRCIVLAGRPNAGKSTLFNALVEADRVIVSDRPGTTRDPVRERIAVDQVPFELVDTAGVAEPRDRLERLSIERTRDAVREAHLILYLFDAEAGVREDEIRFLDSLRDRPVVTVVNKIDAGARPPGLDALPVSARTGEGLDAIRSGILKALGLAPRVEEGAPVVFTGRQDRLLREAASGSPIGAAKDRLLRGPDERA